MKVGLTVNDSVLSDGPALSSMREFFGGLGFDTEVANALLAGQEVYLTVTAMQLSRCVESRDMQIHFPPHRSGDLEELYQCILRRAHPLAKANGFEVDEEGGIALDPDLGGAWVSGRFFVRFQLPT